MEDLKYWIMLNMTPLLPSQIHLLVRRFGSPRAVVEALPEAINSILKIEQSRDIVRKIRNVNVEREIEEAKRRGVKIIAIDDPTYPNSLKNIFDPPPVLYILGEPLHLNGRLIAIVGSRRATLYGKSMASLLARELVRYGAVVVSGMARGIDTFAHKGALEGGGGTIAVLGSGLDVIYPKENTSLMKEIIATGCVISEFPFGTKPFRQNFPRRNRVIAGLSMGVVVVEARAKSGALITAEYALENGRDIFAVPGRADGRYSEGTNNLIKQGAKLVTNVRDILEEYPDIFYFEDGAEKGYLNKKIDKPLEEDEAKVFEYLDLEPKHIESISHGVGISVSKAITALMGLQMKGLVKELRGKMFIRAN